MTDSTSIVVSSSGAETAVVSRDGGPRPPRNSYEQITRNIAEIRFLVEDGQVKTWKDVRLYQKLLHKAATSRQATVTQILRSIGAEIPDKLRIKDNSPVCPETLNILTSGVTFTDLRFMTEPERREFAKGLGLTIASSCETVRPLPDTKSLDRFLGFSGQTLRGLESTDPSGARMLRSFIADCHLPQHEQPRDDEELKRPTLLRWVARRAAIAVLREAPRFDASIESQKEYIQRIAGFTTTGESGPTSPPLGTYINKGFIGPRDFDRHNRGSPGWQRMEVRLEKSPPGTLNRFGSRPRQGASSPSAP